MRLDAIHTVAVLGLGTMGHGIAQVFAAAGYSVRCYDDQPAARERLPELLRQNLQVMVEADFCRQEEVERILARLVVCSHEEEAVAPAQFVIEAIREDLAAKQALFVRLECVASSDAILASNSSTFPMTATAQGMRTPQRALVTHWFNPPHLVPTVEVVPGERTDEQTTQTTLDLLKKVGKSPVRVQRELPGFLVNRVQNALKREVWDLLERGVASAADIDAALRGSLGFRLAVLGPLEVNDFCGLDLEATNYRNLVPTLCAATTVPVMIQRLVAAGHLGVKTGKGLHDYPPGVAAQRQQRRDTLLLALAKLLAEYPDQGS